MTQPNTQGSKSYLALSFAPLKLSDDGQTQSVSGPPIVTTIKEIEKVGQPFKIPAGKYFLTLKVLNDIPVLDSASDQYRYLNAIWHMEPEGLRVADKKPTEIRVVQHLEGGIGDYKKFNPTGPGRSLLELGEIEVKRGTWHYEVVGDVHRYFWHKSREPSWQSDVLTFKKLSPNPKYYILVE